MQARIYPQVDQPLPPWHRPAECHPHNGEISQIAGALLEPVHQRFPADGHVGVGAQRGFHFDSLPAIGSFGAISIAMVAKLEVEDSPQQGQDHTSP